MTLAPGQTFAGDYELLRPLGAVDLRTFSVPPHDAALLVPATC